jgi:hypothetical protein
MKILRDIIRQGDGFVDVDSVSGGMAMVSAHDNPGSKMLGGASVPVEALRVVSGMEASSRESKIAKKLVGAGLVMARLKNAERMIEGGGRGIELGIREIGYLAKDVEELYKKMRKIQSGDNSDVFAPPAQTDLLEVLGRYM